MKNKPSGPCLTLALLCLALPAAADTPTFDRPGIAFSTGVVPAASVLLEQGLPDFEHDRQAGVRSRFYSADTNLRLGVVEHVELQLATALFNQLSVKSGSASHTDRGRGDTRLGVKLALPSSSPQFSWATLASVTAATGEQPFSVETTQYDVGVAASWVLPSGPTAELYFNGTHLQGDDALTISPSLGFELTDTLSSYIEAGYYRNAHAPDQHVAGGGLAWMATPTVQLDASADFGLDARSTDIAGGVGISVFFR